MADPAVVDSGDPSLAEATVADSGAVDGVTPLTRSRAVNFPARCPPRLGGYLVYPVDTCIQTWTLPGDEKVDIGRAISAELTAKWLGRTPGEGTSGYPMPVGDREAENREYHGMGI